MSGQDVMPGQTVDAGSIKPIHLLLIFRIRNLYPGPNPMPAIHVLEKSPWFVSGLRRAFPENMDAIHFCDNAQQFLELERKKRGAIAVIDLDSLPEQGIAAISEMTVSEQNQRVIFLVNRAQKGIIWEVMQTGCLCYLEKPVSMRILSQLCQRISRQADRESCQ